MNNITVVLTSCNRPKELTPTLISFFKYNTYPIKKIIIIDDSGINGCIEECLKYTEESALENIMIERIKQNEYLKRYANSYFWRTKDGLEIDYVEEVNGVLTAYEFKWNVHKKHRITSVFSKTYGIAEVKVITPENYMEFVTF